MLMLIVCVNICIIVVESYVHAYMTDGDGFCIHIGDDEYLYSIIGGDYDDSCIMR